uniref:rRNA methylase n=1 Tax=Thermosporothrix sp. COM3 TaxID=2490863 RepID=A0A455SQS6_9CHLR|nr:rRNA methylase [Thermosporothrix sp. COM3]
MTERQSPSRRSTVRTSWDPLAEWYDGWSGKDGSLHHRKLAIPTTLELLDPQMNERILDIGAGLGALAPHVAARLAQYVGVDVSVRMVQKARKYHGHVGTFLQGDARHLHRVPGIQSASFEGAVFLLSIQDMNPLADVLRSAAWALRGGGRLIILMIHPCFRVPRQSGWGWQEERALQYRRVDRYLTPLAVPLKEYPGKAQGSSRSFHRPLHEYVNGLADSGFVLDRMEEIISSLAASGAKSKAEARAHQEIPLFLALRARKL